MVDVWRVELDSEATAGSQRASARRALRAVLGHCLGQDPAEIELTTAAHGKPELADPAAGIEFNLSHSGGLALVAVSASHPVGVDVERVARERNFVALAKRELGSEVVAALEAAPAKERAAIFYAAWARHEARLKCFGGGLGGPPPSEPVTVTDLAVGDGYAAALAVPTGAPAAVRLYRLDRS